MKRILVPTDFSDEALNALKFAIFYAKQFRWGITVFNCYSLPPSGVTVMVDISDALRQTAEENMHNLRKHVVNLNLADEVDIEYTTEPGSVVDVLHRHSNSGHNPLVVMGTHGSSGSFENWIGSNTAAVSNGINLPLLAVPASAEVRPVSKILFTTDFKPLKDLTAARLIKDIAVASGANLQFLNVHTRDDKSPEAVRTSFQAWADEQYAEVPHSFMFVNDDEIEEGIQTAIRHEKPDLLIMVRHRYSLFETIFHSSVTRKIIHKALLPLLIIRD